MFSLRPHFIPIQNLHLMPLQASLTTNTWKSNSPYNHIRILISICFISYLSQYYPLLIPVLINNIIMSSLAIFFLLSLSMHACHARHHLGTFVAEELAKPVHFLPKAVNKLNHEVGSHGRRRIQESWVGANTMKQAFLNCFFKAKEAVAVAEAVSGNEINNSGIYELQNVEKVEGFKRLTRSMLGNSADVESKEKENVWDIDVMDYAQPHRKPPIHNEKP